MTNEVTREELIELITHLAFYAGWPIGGDSSDITGFIASTAVPSIGYGSGLVHCHSSGAQLQQLA